MILGVAKMKKDKIDEVLEKIAAVCHGCFKAEICDIPINNCSDVSEKEFCFSFDIEDNYLFKIDYPGHEDYRPLLWNYPGLIGYLSMYYALDMGYNKIWLNIYDPCTYDIYYTILTDNSSDYAVLERVGHDYGERPYADEVVKFNKERTIEAFKDCIRRLFDGEYFEQVKICLAKEFEYDFIGIDEYNMVSRVIYFYEMVSQSEWVFGKEIKPLTEKDLLDDRAISILEKFKEEHDDDF